MNDTNLDIDHLRGWIGRTETADDVATTAPLNALGATLDHDDPPWLPGAPIPPCWHWLYFLETARQSRLDPDGHAPRGGFLPPVPLPRRMFAGSRIEFRAPLLAGESLRRRSRIEDVTLKEGRNGPLVFLRVRHEIHAQDRLAIVEEDNIVYRDMPTPGAAAAPSQAAPADATWSRRIEPDEVLLFRYSALTFNGHRIHYDRRYATEVEGYPGLVVHGPLLATLLLDLVRREQPDAQVRDFRFRAVKPLFAIAPFAVCGNMRDEQTIELWSRDAAGHVTVQATVTLD